MMALPLVPTSPLRVAIEALLRIAEVTFDRRAHEIAVATLRELGEMA